MKIFIIMPIGSNPCMEIKSDIIQKITKTYGYQTDIPLYDLKNPTFDLDLLINQINKSSFVIADLSYERPSCYYELGIAETLHKKIYALAESGTNLHQTTLREKVIFYKNIEDFRNQVERIVKDSFSSYGLVDK
jgi:hypothetical protein